MHFCFARSAFRLHDPGSVSTALRSVLQKPLRLSPIILRLVHLLRETTPLPAGEYSPRVDIDATLIKLLSQKFADRIQFRWQSNRFARNRCVCVKYHSSRLYRNSEKRLRLSRAPYLFPTVKYHSFSFFPLFFFFKFPTEERRNVHSQIRGFELISFPPAELIPPDIIWTRACFTRCFQL